MSGDKKQNLRVRRDSDGNLYPLAGLSPTLGIPVEIIPLTYGESRSYDSFGKALSDWTDEEKARLLREHVKEPNIRDDDDEFTVEMMRDDFDAWTIEDLFQAVAVYSGLSRLFEDPAGTEGNEEGEAKT